MTYHAPSDVTEQLVKDARSNEVAVKNSLGEVFLVRLLGTEPGYLVKSAQTLAVVYMIDFADVLKFFRSIT